jgi:hypothetical protein
MRGLCLSFFIECMLSWLAGWCMAGLGEMLLHHTPLLRKIHELLLMSSPTPLLKSTWIPNSPLELFICSFVLLLLLLPLQSLYCSTSLRWKASADMIISSLISSITLSSCSCGWLCSCSLLC